MTRQSKNRPDAKSNDSFELARWLQGRGYVGPLECRRHIEYHSEMHDWDVETYWVDFNDAWDRVKYADRGRDTFADAVDKMKQQRIEFPPGVNPPSDLYVQVASIAYYLWEFTNGNPFLLPVSRLRDALGYPDKITSSRIISWLVRRQVIVVVDATSSKRERRAKKYNLGPVLPKTNQENQSITKLPEDCGSHASKIPRRVAPWPSHDDFTVPF